MKKISPLVVKKDVSRKLFAALFLALLASTAAHADTYTWTNAFGDNYWEDANWSGGSTTFPNSAGDVANATSGTGVVSSGVIKVSGVDINENPVSDTLGILNIGDAAGGIQYAIQNFGGVLTFDNNGVGAAINEFSTKTGGDSISAPILMADNLTVTNSGTQTFVIAGGITDAGAHTLTITDTNGLIQLQNINGIGGALNFASGINSLDMNPSGLYASLTAGSLTMGTYGFAIVSGTNLGANASSSQTTGSTNITFTATPAFVGSTVQTTGGVNSSQKNTAILPHLLNAASATTFMTYDTTNGLRALDASEYSNDAIVTGDNTNLTTGTTTSSTTTSINSLLMSGGNLTINDGTSLNIASGAILFVNNDGTGISPSGSTGILDFGTAQGVINVNSGEHNISAVITGSNGLVKIGSGQLDLSGNNTYTGTTAVLNGYVKTTNANAFGSNGNTILVGDTVGSNNAQVDDNYTNATDTNNYVIQGGNTGTASIGMVEQNGGTLTYSGNITLGSNGTAHGLTIYGDWQDNFAFSGNISDPAGVTSGGGLLTIDNLGGRNVTFQFTGTNNTFTGGISINAGTIYLANSTAAGTGTIAFGEEGDGTFLSVAQGGLTINNNITISPGGIGGGGTDGYGAGSGFNISQSQGGSSYGPTINGTTGLIGGGMHYITMAWSNLTLNGEIYDGGDTAALTLTQINGPANITLNGANTFSGGLYLTSGSTQGGGRNLNLNIGNLGTTSAASAFGTGTFTILPVTVMANNSVSFDNTSGAAGTVSTNNAEDWSGDFTFVGTNSLNMGTGAVTLGESPDATRTVTVANNTFETDGVISDGTNTTTPTTNLAMNGPGTMILGGVNTYTGSTTINSGTLIVGGAGSLGSGNYAAAIVNNGTFGYSSSATQTLSGTLSGIGVLQKSGTGALTLSGNGNTYSGGTTISAGTLIVANTSGSATGSGGVSLGAATLAGTGIISGAVTATGASGSSVINPGSLTAVGNLTLNGGVSSLSGLTLNFAIDGAGATNSTLTLGSAGLDVSGLSLTFNLYDLGTNTLESNTAYTLITGTGALSVGSLTANLLDSAYTLDTSYGTNGILISGDTATFEVIAAAVPEPSTWALMLGGFALLIFFRHRRKEVSER